MALFQYSKWIRPSNIFLFFVLIFSYHLGKYELYFSCLKNTFIFPQNISLCIGRLHLGLDRAHTREYSLFGITHQILREQRYWETVSFSLFIQKNAIYLYDKSRKTSHPETYGWGPIYTHRRWYLEKCV